MSSPRQSQMENLPVKLLTGRSEPTDGLLPVETYFSPQAPDHNIQPIPRSRVQMTTESLTAYRPEATHRRFFGHSSFLPTQAATRQDPTKGKLVGPNSRNNLGLI
jgi:hypothetical protein